MSIFHRILAKSAGGLAAVAGVAISSGVALADAPSWAAPGSVIEKCAGIARAGQNDCGANGHDCAGHAERDNDPNEWVYVPQGVCGNIAGGRVIGTRRIPSR
ncbi:MAG: DUF2282 domain-containing protein [Myxococcota bacterium]